MTLPHTRDYSANNEAILPLFFPHALTKFLNSHGIPTAAVLAGTGITSDSLRSLDARISHSKHSLLLQNADKAWGKPGLGLSFGSSLKLHSLGMIGQAARSSQTLGDAMDTITKYLALRSPLLSFAAFREAAGTMYVLTGSRNLGESERFMIEAAFAATMCFLTELAGQKLTAIEFSFGRDAHAPYQLYQDVLGTRVKFDAQSDRFLLPSACAKLTLSTSNQMSAEEARRYCDNEIAQIGIETGFKQVVFALINSRLKNSPTETETAAFLGCSPRSMRRRLLEQNTTFRDLLKQARFESGKKLLTSTHMSVEEIAHEIGYINVGNFSRAFKVWTGVSPSTYRRHPG